ncbi:MAG: methyltransferase domain-containing protein [Xanthomonadales bacterium]|nr:methyltransferase domain-containing protein [Xanthomonadales bacterium]
MLALTLRERRFKQALIRQADIRPGHRVLDLACGTATLTLWIQETHPEAEVRGVDGDGAILELARRKAQAAGIDLPQDQALSDDLPYPDGHFDRILSCLFFHHLDRDARRRTAAELYRIMKPGAQLHVADWGPPANPLMRGLFYGVRLLDGFENTRDNVSGRLPGVFESAGFSGLAHREEFNTVYGTLLLFSAIRGA